MNVNKYEVFLKTVELGSLTKAGEELKYTQSGISHILNSLEKECGMRLLERDRSGVYLNSVGKTLYPYIQKVCECHQQLSEVIDTLLSLESGTIRIGTMTSISTAWLPKLLQSFNEIYPNIKFQMLCGEYSDIEKWIQHGNVDMGFVKEPVSNDLTVYHLKKDEMMAVLPMGHPLAKLEKIPHNLLSQYPFILYIDDENSEIKEILDKYGIASKSQYITKEDYSIMSMVEFGMGISVLPGLVLHRCPYHIEIRGLLPTVYRSLAIAVKYNDILSPIAKEFLKHILNNIP